MQYGTFYRESGYARFARQERSSGNGTVEAILADQRGHAFADPATPDIVIGLTVAGQTPARWKVGATWRETDCRDRGCIGVSPMNEALEFDVPEPHRLLIVTIARSFVEDVKSQYASDVLDVLNTLHHAYIRDPETEFLLNGIWRSLERLDTLTDLRADGLTQLLIAQLLATRGEDRPKRTDRGYSIDLAQLEDYVRSRVGERITVADLAATCAMPPAALARQLKIQANLAPYAFVQSIRFRMAVERVRHGRDDLGRIALDLGFADQAHFSRAYRARLGVPPSAHRRGQRS